MLMHQAIIGLFFALCSTSGVIAQTSCSNYETIFNNCLRQLQNFTIDESGVNVTACYDCEITYIYMVLTPGSLSCVDGTNLFCDYYQTCNDVCYPKLDFCQKEFDDFNACNYGESYTTECVVQCSTDGSILTPSSVVVTSPMVPVSNPIVLTSPISAVTPIVSPMATTATIPTSSPTTGTTAISIPVATSPTLASPISGNVTAPITSPMAVTIPTVSPTTGTTAITVPTISNPTITNPTTIDVPTTISSVSPTRNIDQQCNEKVTRAEECFIRENVNVEEDDDDNKTKDQSDQCIQCFTDNKFYDNYDTNSTSCNTANIFICVYFDLCFDVCFLPIPNKFTVCQNEIVDYYICIYGLYFAPQNCTVECDGLSSSSSNNTTNSTSDSTNNNNTTNNMTDDNNSTNTTMDDTNSTTMMDDTNSTSMMDDTNSTTNSILNENSTDTSYALTMGVSVVSSSSILIMIFTWGMIMIGL